MKIKTVLKKKYPLSTGRLNKKPTNRLEIHVVVEENSGNKTAIQTAKILIEE